MMNHPLSIAVSRFAELVLDLPDSALEQEWSWGSYESEGVRFAFFRTYEELRELAVKIRVARDTAGIPLTGAQLILAQYHAAYMDIQSMLMGIDQKFEEQPPAEGEWPLRRIIAHIIGADLGFYVTIKYALERYRQGLDHLAEVPDETWLAIAGLDGKKLDSIMAEPLDGLQTYHRQLHRRILEDFVDINPSELQMHSKYWEKEPLSVSFRLGRFDSHLRQHTVQIEKTLVDLGYHPNESKRLLRLIYAALAGVEGALLGEPKINSREIELLAKKITARTEELRPILS
jgi:hypothetical protein